MEFFASCPMGFEDALADELRAIGLARVRRLSAQVSFEGDTEAALRACLWSRLSSRVLAVLGRFEAENADELYAGANDLAWEQILMRDATIAVAAHGVNDRLRNTRFTALRVKDAICDALAQRCGARPMVDGKAADARIMVALRGSRVTVSLDLSGGPLFRRLPGTVVRLRKSREIVGLRPDYAALMLAQDSGWRATVEAVRDGGTVERDGIGDPVLIDLTGGGGDGLLLEALDILLDRAPGLTRPRWGFQGWAAYDPHIWNEMRAVADERARAARRRRFSLIATDPDPAALADTEELLRAMQLAEHVEIVSPDALFVLGALGGTASAEHVARTGIIVADMTGVAECDLAGALALAAGLHEDPLLAAWPLIALERQGGLLGRAMGAAPSRGLHVRMGNEDGLISTFESGAADDPNERAASHASQVIRDSEGVAAPNRSGRAESRASRAMRSATRCGSGRMSVDLGDGAPIPVLMAASEQFAHRLKKVARLRRRWARRTGVSSYRVYDADLPDYAASIDLYSGAAETPGRWLVIAEYAAPSTIEPELAHARFLDILTIASRVLEVEPGNVFAKARRRSRGGSQYGRQAGGSRTSARSAGDIAKHANGMHRPPLIEEGGLTFEVNFDDRLDTGIFLDHRITRNMLRERAQGRSFLNLFGYTGTATCYAADGGARETTTVDLSNTYLAWTDRNLDLNGFTGREHELVRADVLTWMSAQRRSCRRWDLIFCDPPTFSNSAKMGERTFDIQRDHVELLAGVADLIAPDGEAVFSCNLRTFRPDRSALARAGVVLDDITSETIPEDFARNRRIHRCYFVHRAEDAWPSRDAGTLGTD